MTKVVAASGYFDPLHVGHLEYLEKARQLGDKLIVIINNDIQTKLKKGFVFMIQEDRMKIIKALRYVDDAFLSIDNDESVCKSIELLKPDIFAKGGDRKIHEIPETPICRKLGIEIIDGLGDKIRASSEILKKLQEENKNE